MYQKIIIFKNGNIFIWAKKHTFQSEQTAGPMTFAFERCRWTVYPKVTSQERIEFGGEVIHFINKYIHGKL